MEEKLTYMRQGAIKYPVFRRQEVLSEEKKKP